MAMTSRELPAPNVSCSFLLVIQSGGLGHLQPDEVARILWSYATLNTLPGQMLQRLPEDWSWQQGTRGET